MWWTNFSLEQKMEAATSPPPAKKTQEIGGGGDGGGGGLEGDGGGDERHNRKSLATSMDTIPEEPREGAMSEAEATTEKKTKKEAFASLAMRMMFDISIGNIPPRPPRISFVLFSSLSFFPRACSPPFIFFFIIHRILGCVAGARYRRLCLSRQAHTCLLCRCSQPGGLPLVLSPAHQALVDPMQPMDPAVRLLSLSLSVLRSSCFVLLLRSSCFTFSCFVTNFRFVKVCEKEKGAEVVRQVKKTLPQRLVPFPAARTAHTTAHAARHSTNVVFIWRYGP